MRYHTYEIGDHDIHVRTLRDLNQFHDPDGRAEAVGISSANWPLFGVVWDVGRALAEEVATMPLRGGRALEIGCGLALPSLVLAKRGVEVVAADHHPIAGDFLAVNAALNDVTVPFVRADWSRPHPELGRFDLILGSDVLYEADHVRLLSQFIERHAERTCEVVVVDAIRGHQGRFTRAMVELGFRDSRTILTTGETRAHLLRYRRQ